MTKLDLRFRQVHLDFHTSEHIVGIGTAFDPDEFADTLVKAHVDSITCFARCHHGWIYYDSKLNPERVHPHLSVDLLRQQIDVCHARGIKVPIYTTVHWDHYTATRHPEWLALDDDGTIRGTKPYEDGFYNWLCLNSPYLDFLKAHVQEILETLPVDGLFLDIVHPIEDSSQWTKKAMIEQGKDPSDRVAREQYGIDLVNYFRDSMSEFIRGFQPSATVFYNQGHVGPQHKVIKDAYSHWEIESLPTGGWGYMHFPIAIRYARTLGQESLGMTGKFHTTWGDFHSFKNKEALEFECYRMLAHGAKCSIGDQLPPDGRIDPYVYELIGAVYSEVEAKEPWCIDAEPVVEIGVFTPEEFAPPFKRHIPPALSGVTRMLEESDYQFDIIDSQSDFSPYRLLILPDHIPVDEALKAKLDVYVSDGGSILASYESGMDYQGQQFTLDSLGVTLIDDGPTDLHGVLVRGKSYIRNQFSEYILPSDELNNGMYPTEYVMYMRGLNIRANDDSQILGHIVPSYFDRTYQHFFSHRQTPADKSKRQPGIVQNDNVIYFSSPIFSQYHQNAPKWCKTLVQNAIDRLLNDKLVTHTGPSSLQITITEQIHERRWNLHLLHYIPERRSQDFDIIEDVIPLYGVQVSVNVPNTITAVTCVPQNEPLDYSLVSGRVEFELPILVGHQIISIDLANE